MGQCILMLCAFTKGCVHSRKVGPSFLMLHVFMNGEGTYSYAACVHEWWGHIKDVACAYE